MSWVSLAESAREILLRVEILAVSACLNVFHHRMRARSVVVGAPRVISISQVVISSRREGWF
jgi:hypothetical protein